MIGRSTGENYLILKLDNMQNFVAARFIALF